MKSLECLRSEVKARMEKRRRSLFEPMKKLIDMINIKNIEEFYRNDDKQFYGQIVIDSPNGKIVCTVKEELDILVWIGRKKDRTGEIEEAVFFNIEKERTALLRHIAELCDCPFTPPLVCGKPVYDKGCPLEIEDED